MTTGSIFLKQVCLLAVLLLSALFSPLFANVGDYFYSETIEGVRMSFRVTSEKLKTCEVMEWAQQSAISRYTTGIVTIPSVVNDYNVTRIGDHAFHWCSGLTSITIPNSVTSIDSYAFAGCSGLTSITIPNSVTSIGNDAFEYCRGLTSITIPNSVTSIRYSAFSNCSGLTSITIPNSVTSIEWNVFEDCSGLTSIIVDTDNKTYDSRNNCNAIIDTSSDSLILGCVNTIIPPSVTTIGYGAFFGCSSLSKLFIPNSVNNIVAGAFSGCSGLTNIIVDANNKIYDSRNNCNAIIETSTGCLICGCKNTIIPSSVTSIGNYAFEGSGLTTIDIPNSVTSIGSSAFEGCRGLTSITIPNSVTSIGYYAFRDTQWLANQPNGLVYAGKIAYEYIGIMPANTVIELDEGTLGIAVKAFSYCEGLTSITIPNSVTSIGDDAFEYCSGLTSITIPNSVTSIGKRAFSVCSGLTNITVPNSVTSIGSYAFSGCSGLTSITISNSVTSIEDGAFSGCSGLTSITIPNSVTSIGRNAFSYCEGLTSITIPNSVTSIGRNAFSALKSIYSLIEEPMDCGGSWSNCYYATLYVPLGTSEKYKRAGGWDDFSEIKEMADGLVFLYPTKENVMMNFTITDMNSLTCQVGEKQNRSISQETEAYVTIPQSAGPFTVNEVVDNAFEGCSSLTGISFPETVKSINYQLLKDCKALASIEWNADVPIVGNLVVTNPNMLLYAKDRAYAPNTIKNVVINGYAESIVLQDAADGNNFNCPIAFTAKTARYVHNYSMTSGYNTCQGWETIALPFDVTTITAQDGTELVPFAVWKNGEGKKPFWLYEMTEEGWKEADGIKANKPYLISMPNNRYYPEEYNVKGDVTFVGNDVEVYASDNFTISTYDNRKFIPNFLNNDASRSVYTLNVSNLWNNNTVSKIEGSAFLRNLRHVHPFEAYITMEGAEAPDIIPVFENGMPTSIQTVPLRNVHIHNANDSWYSLDGRKLQCKPTAKGVYIVNGSKVVIK